MEHSRRLLRLTRLRSAAGSQAGESGKPYQPKNHTLLHMTSLR
jgi:hypothetical protein